MIRIKTIYYMLSYAFQILNEQGYKQLLTEKFDNTAELCAAILSKGVSLQIKRGLGKAYLSQTESLAAVKEKINITASIKEQSFMQKKLICTYDEFSVNFYMNRIIKTTMDLLLHSEISKARKKELRKLFVFFGDVKPINIKNINWQIQYNKTNQSYQMLISICYLIIKGLLQTNSDGTTKLMDFLDEQRMCKLYEKFILNYYKKEHSPIKTSSSQISWDLDDNKSDMLPVMQSDIMLQYKEKTLIIDAKYYSHTMQTHYDVHTLHSNNLYQIYTYVKNFDKEKTGNVSGMLLYAKTDEITLPQNSYQISGNKIMVDTLNLDCDFIEIKKHLDNIVIKHFSI